METTTQYPDEIISAGQLLRILDSDAKEISSLCQRACLKPKKDGFGNIYFSKSDVDVLRKVKELYAYTRKLQEEKNRPQKENEEIKELKEHKFKSLKQKEEKFDYIEENISNKTMPVKFEDIKPLQLQGNSSSVVKRIDSMENNIISKMTDMLSEKLDGLDEVIVELIKAKTENESLRQKINNLNKENFALKNENASYRPVGLGLYIKKSTDDFTV